MNALKMPKLIIITFIIYLVSATVNSQEKEINETIDSREYTFEECVNQFDIEKKKETKSGYQYWFADKNFTDDRTLKMSVVNPNQATHPPHSHVEDEFFFVLEGTAKFYLNGKTIEAGPYTSLYCPSNSEHGISNGGKTVLKYLVIKKYAETK